MESIWNNCRLPEYTPLQGDIKTDVLVIGGGIAGLLCAYYLRSSGVSCVVAEADRIGHGITKNTTAKVTSQHGLIYHKLISRFGVESAQQHLDINEQSVSEFRKLCKNMDCHWEDQTNFIFSRGNHALLEREYTALQSLGFPAKAVQELPLPFPTAGAVAFPNQGQFHPLQFFSTISKDMTIFEKTPIRELTKSCAITDRGRIFADSFIVATHFPFLNKHGSYFMKLYQQRSYVLALQNIPTFEGMYLDAQENGLSFRHYGNTLLLGGGGHRTGKQGGGWKELEQITQKYYPNATITQRWATQDCMTLDGLPYIGQYSKNTPNLFVATGFNKWGMSSSMVSARILTDLVQGRSNPYADIFSPSRNMLHKQLGLNLLESTKNLLMPTAPRCPHLGCALKWNQQEHSWDCPCHGSRFDKNGHLIDNPATGDLKKRK